MRVAILGTRGVPANYGGFETFAEELGSRLAARGHNVFVYCRRGNADYSNISAYKGINLIILPTIRHKYLDTVVHTFLSSLHACFCHYDVVLFCNAANACFTWIPKLVGQKVAINVDGIERKRKKWNRLGKLWYRVGEYLATKLPDVIVSDARVIQQYYKDKYGADSVMIPYGAYVGKVEGTETLQRLGLTPGGYILYVSRLEPENNAHIVIEAFKQVSTEKKLVIVGDAPYSNKYKSYLKSLAASDDRILMPGAIYGPGYRELQSHAYCYVQATEVGGTHPALIEAMGHGNCVIANGTPENVEVVADAGIIYEKNNVYDLAQKLRFVLANQEKVKEYGQRAAARVAREYSWEAVTDKYEQLFLRLTAIPCSHDKTGTRAK